MSNFEILFILFNRYNSGWALGAVLAIIFGATGVWYFLFPEKKEKPEALKDNIKSRFENLLFGIISFVVLGGLALLVKECS